MLSMEITELGKIRSNLYYLQYPANAQADKETSRQL